MAIERGFGYERPPVRNVKLAVMFDPLVGFGLPEMTALQNKWSKNYPTVRHGHRSSLPRPQWNERDFPFPSVIYTDPTLTKTVAYQSERLVLEWTFSSDADGYKYPGYEVLSKELWDRFAEFREVVDVSLDDDLRVRACSCTYRNTLGDTPVTDAVVGVFTQWQVPALGVHEDEHLTDLRMNLGETDTLEGLRRNCRITLSRLRQSGLNLTISVVALDSGESTVDQFELMDSAHAKLISKFELSTSDSMKSEWGRYDFD